MEENYFYGKIPEELLNETILYCSFNQNCFNETTCNANDTLSVYKCGCIYNESCLIDGTCHANGEYDGSCLYCNIDFDKTYWSNVDDDTICDDGNATTQYDIKGYMNQTIQSESKSKSESESESSSSSVPQEASESKSSLSSRSLSKLFVFFFLFFVFFSTFESKPVFVV